ncbi:MAG: hypothetical protein FWE07_06435 [Turicibacter sp.]|nr:hypothetical protein [Turicibacter sp.]
MSKLRDNPAKEVPRRVLILAPIITLLIFAATFIFEFNFFVVGGFFWLATFANMIAFHLIVKGADRMITKKQAGEKATIMPNLMIRYCLYIVVLLGAVTLGDLPALIAAFIGVQMSQIVIKLDSFVG